MDRIHVIGSRSQKFANSFLIFTMGEPKSYLVFQISAVCSGIPGF